MKVLPEGLCPHPAARVAETRRIGTERMTDILGGARKAEQEQQKK